MRRLWRCGPRGSCPGAVVRRRGQAAFLLEGVRRGKHGTAVDSVCTRAVRARTDVIRDIRVKALVGFSATGGVDPVGGVRVSRPATLRRIPYACRSPDCWTPHCSDRKTRVLCIHAAFVLRVWIRACATLVLTCGRARQVARSGAGALGRAGTLRS